MANQVFKASCEMIVEKDNQWLLGKRKNIYGAGQWCFPGGHLEIGESTVECAKRELLEETGIVPTQMKLITVINDVPDRDDNQYIRFVYLITDYTGEVRNPEPDCCEGWQYFEKNQLPTPFFVGQQKVLDFLLNRITGVMNVEVLEK